MKKVIVNLLVFLSWGSLYGQTNTFPSSGNVGIGTTSPVSPLTVVGKTFIFGNLEIRGDEYAEFVQGTDSDSRGVTIGPDDFGLKTRYRVWANGSRAYNQVWYDQGGSDFFYGGSFNPIFSIKASGIGIGVSTPTHKLEVNGTIRAKEIKLEATNWPDYVFEKGYRLMPLNEVKTHIDQKGHLPGLKSAREYQEEGVNMLELNQKLLEKVEELTLHVVRQQETQHLQASIIKMQQERLEALEKKLDESKIFK